MHKKLILTLVVFVGIISGAYYYNKQNNNQEEANTVKAIETEKYFNIVDLETFYNNQAASTEVVEVVASVNTDILEEFDEKDVRPEIPNIPLDDKLLDYIYKESTEHNIAYTLVLAIMKVESNFNPKAISNTNDYGLSQINKTTARWIAKELGLSKYDLKNPYTSTDFCIFYLSYLSEKYRNMGMSEEDIFNFTVVSYNRGEGSGYKYVKKYGAESNSYWKKVMKAKEELEMSME
jgi:Soluble lytic murein transglycosylase and related regulatory proteins (some contain LysM/invasin domains)